MYNNTKKQKFIFASILIIIGGILLALLNLTIKTTTFDESFSILMTQRSFAEIWYITAKDVHPPLYYFMLKAFIETFGDSLFIYRLFSTLGVIATLLTGLIFIPKYFEIQSAILFIFLLLIMPVTQYLSSDIRMYAWAMFFVFTSALSAYRIITNGRCINYISLIIFSLCAAYTQYFALLGIIVIYVLLIGYLCYNKRSIKKLFLILLLFIIGYSIWMPELYSQVTRVNNKYWIEALNAKEILLLGYYSFSPKEPSHPYFVFNLPTMSVALSIVFILLGFLSVYIIQLYRKKIACRRIIKIGIFFTSIFILSVFIGIMYSLLIKPVIIPRYTMSYLACLLLGVSILLLALKRQRKNGKYILYFSLLVLEILSIARFFNEKEYNKGRFANHIKQEAYFANKNTHNTVFMSPLHSSEMLERFTIEYPNNLFFIYSKQKTPFIFKPSKCIEVNKLPKDFDFYMILGNDPVPLQIENAKEFIEAIKDDFTINDSLILDDRKIYQMRTIHRNRE